MKKYLVSLLLTSFLTISVAQNTDSTITPQNSTSKSTHTTKKKKTQRKKNTATKKQPSKKHSTKHNTKSKYKKSHKKPIAIVSNNYGASEDIPNDYINSQLVKRQPKLYSYASVVLNAKTGEIFISKNPNAKLPIASISKLMTAMILLDSGVNLNDYVTITADDIDDLRNTYSRLKVGLQFRRSDLLLLALMSSENRAAHALARTTYQGGLSVFIRKMNEKAKSLGMNNTQFYDPTGLTNKNQSTAMDLSKMVQAAYSYEQIRKDTTSKEASVMFGPRYVHHYKNTDVLVRDNKMQIELSKTGFINEAGHCLVLYSIIENTPVVMVFLDSSGKSGRILDAMTVKNYVLKMKG